MKTVYDMETRRYLRILALAAALVLCAAIVLCFYQAQALRQALLSNDRMLASALLEEGVPRAGIAAALSSREETAEGAAFLEEIGWGVGTALRHYPPAGAFFLSALAPAIAVALLLTGAAAYFTLRYFRGRERLYERCAAALERFMDGDYSVRLPRAELGGFYSLLAATDTLAMTLESRSESERRAKEGLQELMSDISHQLKTPMAALRLYNDLMAENADDAKTVRVFTAKSSASLDRMEGLVQTLLKVMRLDTGNVRFNKEPCRACDIAARAAEELLTRAEREGKTLKLQGDAGATLCCDPQWTAEALMNLIKNALDYTKSGGNICVSWERSPGMLRISVADDGAGIAPEDMPFLFKRFYRSGRSRDIQGVGLGLPLTKAVVEGQGGILGVKSEPGSTVFTASFLN